MAVINDTENSDLEEQTGWKRRVNEAVQLANKLMWLASINKTPVPTILDGTYIYKERSSNTKKYGVQTSRTDAMGVSASHRNRPIAIQPSWQPIVRWVH